VKRLQGLFARAGDVIRSSHTGLQYEVSELGIMQTKQIPRDVL